jgi:hypothetical protein
MASLLPGGKLRPRPPEITDANLEKRFTAEKFDADFIVELAVAAGMRYVNFTPYHGAAPTRSARKSPIRTWPRICRPGATSWANWPRPAASATRG